MEPKTERYFIVFSMGHSASTWLSKVLNAHYEVICLHEPEYTSGYRPASIRGSLSRRMRARVDPSEHRRYFEFREDELVDNVLSLFTPGSQYQFAYSAVGAVVNGEPVSRLLSDRLAGVPQLADARAKYRSFYLFRHPIAYVNSQHRMFHTLSAALRRGDRRSHRVMVRHTERSLQRMLEHADYDVDQNVDVEGASFAGGRGDLSALWFDWACVRWLDLASRALRPAAGMTACMETLTTDREALISSLDTITGVSYDPSAEVLGDVVNAKNPTAEKEAMFRAWTPDQQRRFREILAPANGPIRELGYDDSAVDAALGAR